MSNGSTRRTLLKWGATGAGAAVGGFSLPAAFAQPAQGRTLTVAWDTDIDSTDPIVFKSIGGYAVQANIYEGPLTWKTRPLPNEPGVSSAHPGEYQGGIAESWRFERDGATMVLNLRQGMKFPSGRPIDAKAFKYTIDRALLGPGYMRHTLPRMLRTTGPDDFVVRDDHTFVINMPAPTPMALEMMSLMTMGVVDPELVKQHATTDDPWAANWMRHNDAGSGPYRLTKNTPGVEVVLDASPNHWAGKPFFERINFKFVPSEADRILLLKRGAVDIVIGRPGLTPKSILSLKGEPNLRTVTMPDTIAHWLCMNQKKAPFDNVLVRRAINYAIPIQAIIPNVLQGFGVQMKSPLSPLTPGCDETLSPYHYDIEKARALMKEAGFAGKTIPVKLAVRIGWSAHEQAAIWIQQELQKIGFQVSIQRQTDATLRQLASKGEQELSLESYLSWINDPFFVMTSLFHSKSAATNTAFYNSPAFDKVSDDSFHEPDPAKRLAGARQAQKILLDDAVTGLLWFDNWTRVMRKDLTGLEKRWDGMERFRNMRLA